jgi:hypothetical protein
VQRFLGGLLHLALDRCQDVGEVLVAGQPLGLEELPHADQRIPPRLGLSLRFRLVQPLIVG